MGNSGNQMGGWYAKEINTVKDLNGLKFRMPVLGGEILKTFGVNVILLPRVEVLPALTSGAIDGTEWIGPAADMGKGLHKVVKNYYYPGWHEPATILDGFIDMNEWENLDKLKAHKLQVHTEGKMQLCFYCGYKNANLFNLRNHIERNHPEHGEKKHLCDFCGEGFMFLQNVK